jgi:hypothetical protein
LVSVGDILPRELKDPREITRRFAPDLGAGLMKKIGKLNPHGGHLQNEFFE